MRLYTPALVAVLSLAGGSLFAQSQSLADVARKEEDRRKNVKEPSKVYTNKDLGTLPPGTPAPPPPVPAPPAAAVKETEKPADKEPPKDQAYWAGRMNELRAQLQRDETYVAALQTRVNSLSADFVNRDDPAQRAVIAADRQKAVAELERLKTQIETTKKALADLEEEARRAGVPPGWLR
jgi:hypothetical protein